MMLLVRIIDLVVNVFRHLAAPEARALRATALVALICGALVGVVGLIWLLAQLHQHFTSP